MQQQRTSPFHAALSIAATILCLLAGACSRQAHVHYPVIAPPSTDIAVPGKTENTDDQAIPKSTRGPAYSLWLQAEQARAEKDFRRAEMLLERALRIEPVNGWYWYGMGRVQLEAGKKEKARQFLLKAKSCSTIDRDLHRRVEQALANLDNL